MRSCLMLEKYRISLGGEKAEVVWEPLPKKSSPYFENYVVWLIQIQKTKLPV